MEPLSAVVEALLRRPLRHGLDWRIAGLENLPETGPVLLAANHVSLADPPLLASVADRRHRRVRFLAMAELFRSPVPRVVLKGLGHIPVARRSETARSSLTAALTHLGWGECVGIFPEGGLSRDLEPRAGQTGAARLARWSGAPVVPAGLWGSMRLAAPGHKAGRRFRVPIAVSIGPPLVVGPDDDVHEATDRIMAAICAEVARARTGYPGPRPGEDPWWVRGPESARLRSCRPVPGGGPDDLAPVDAGECPPPVGTMVGAAPDEDPDALLVLGSTDGRGEQVLDQQLRTIPFFRNLPVEALEAVAAELEPQRFERGDIVFREGDPGEAMYLVASGQVEVLAGAEAAPLAALGPGSFVGELALLLGEPRSATLRVVADSELWALRRRDLDELLTEHPIIGVELSRELGRRLVATNRQLVAPPTTRFTVVFGPGVAGLAAAVQARAGAARVGVLELPGAPATGPLPDGVVRPALDPLDAGTLAGLAGRDVEGIAYLLVAAGSAEDALGRVALDLAEQVAALRSLPGWARRPGRPAIVPGEDGPEALDRVARWVTGQAIGLALSSGGSKALAHLGVLRVLRAEGVVIDAVAGTSGGAMVGAGLAIGL
ncbi:MAG TPA: 1-acyl-sn-glycerol-3-phosphate acyltransferase, partial [Acidimicrobiia bacterium]|nr:1-acyl-sn-glycerol-3-phosphate acyltransferase [Acidimicrobiia bacterium]